MTPNQKKFKKIIIVGWDADLISEIKSRKIKVIGYTSNSKKNSEYKFLGSIKNFKSLDKHIGILLADSNVNLREFVFNKFQNHLFTFISKKSIVPDKSNIGIGCIIQSKVFISENAKINRCVKINVGSQIHHDVIIDDFSVLSPKTVVLGNTNVGKKTFIGASSVLRNKIKIADETFIGMGSVVVKGTKKGLYIGNPAKKVNKRKLDFS